MRYLCLSRNNQRLLCSLLIVIVTFCCLACAVDQLWFREDDLGTILNGLIRNWSDVARVFSADCRSFITPANYQRTAPNVISGFLRPMQNVLFSIIYPIWNVNPWAYFYTHVAVHAFNAMLLFLLCSQCMWISLSLLAGFMFAFYPDVAWLTWIGTVQNSLAVFFLLLCVLLWMQCLRNRVNRLGDVIPATEPESRSQCFLLLSSCVYLLSLLSRETAILLPVWFFFGGFLIAQHQSWLKRIRSGLLYSWPFFVANMIYICMRIWAFGLGTLPRTVRNMSMRFPWLAQYLNLMPTVEKSSLHVQSAIASAQPINDAGAPIVQSSLGSAVYTLFVTRYVSWFESFFNVQLHGYYAILAAIISSFIVCIFLWHAYQGSRKIVLWLIFGLICVSWPGVLAYPSPRYINLVYPFLIVIVVYGVYLILRHPRLDRGSCEGPHIFTNRYNKNQLFYSITSLLILCVAITLMLQGLISNRSNLQSAARDRYIYKQRFDDFFNRYTFTADTRFILVSSPFVSDIQSIFQAYMNNLSTIVVFDPFATYAEFGVMGCRKEYRVTGIASSVVPITRGFRLISHDREHCGWWLRFSDHPIAWVESTRSYEWTNQNYQAGRWYPCSIGKFKINDLVDQDCVADIEFVFDERWMSEQCVFVAWDSQMGQYILI